MPTFEEQYKVELDDNFWENDFFAIPKKRAKQLLSEFLEAPELLEKRRLLFQNTKYLEKLLIDKHFSSVMRLIYNKVLTPFTPISSKEYEQSLSSINQRLGLLFQAACLEEELAIILSDFWH